MCSVVEAECGGLFNNAKTAIFIKRVLEGMENKQKPIGLRTDNSTANAFVDSSMRNKQSKDWDMRFNWLREEKNKDIFKIYLDKGVHNKADYFTKHHSPSHHEQERQKYILK